MLGRFLEVGIHAPDSHESWQQYRRLGFEPAVTGDVWPHAYGVVTCAGLSLGLHARPDAGDGIIDLHFVRPNVAELHRELLARGLKVDAAQLGADVFNQLSLREPTGVTLRVLEARSFSPPPDTPAQTMLGRFLALSLPARDLAVAEAFWRDLGATISTTAKPWPGFSLGGSLPLAYHARQDCRHSVLCFQHPDPDQAELELTAAGLALRPRIASLGDTGHLLLESPEGQALLILA
jgi:hypothetical protein